MIDYIKSYSEQGIDCYRRFLKFEEKYNFGVSASIDICFGFAPKSADFKKGKDLKFLEESEEIAVYLNSFENVSCKSTKTFIRAIIILFYKSNKEQRELVKANILKIPKFSSVSDYTNAFENIINYRKRGENKITL